MIVQFALTLTYVNCKPNLQSKDFTTEDFKSLEKKKEKISFAERNKKYFLLVQKKRNEEKYSEWRRETDREFMNFIQNFGAITLKYQDLFRDTNNLKCICLSKVLIFHDFSWF